MGSLQPLPDASSPGIRLAYATPAERLRQTLTNSAMWKGPLSQEAYLRREQHLANQPLTANFGITYWVLVDTAEPGEPRQVLCGCESIRKRAIVAQDGRTKDTISHCVSNVFCPPEHRGLGYARRMMKELGAVLRTHQTEVTAMESLFSVLWSDIGKTFYAKLGWELYTSSHICIPSASIAASSVLASPNLPKSRPIHASDLASLCAADEQALRRLFSTRSASSPPAISLLPDIQTISWHHAREEFICTELQGKMPEIKGALIPGPPGQRAWCHWTLTWCGSSQRQEGREENILYILRMVVEGANGTARDSSADGSDDDGGVYSQSILDRRRVEMIEALLRAAMMHASLWNMDCVQLWNPTAETVEAAKRLHGAAKVTHREEQGLSSMMWFGRKEDKSRVEWIENEKFGWY